MQRKDVIAGALRYAQSVREWAAAEGDPEGAIKVASEIARVAAQEAYGTSLVWEWGKERATVPVLDEKLATILFSPSGRARTEAQLCDRLGDAGVIDLVGDALTLRLAIARRNKFSLVGEGKGLRLWRHLLSEAAPESIVTFVDIASAGQCPSLAANWVRCVELGHWLDFVAGLPAGWGKPAPVITCKPDDTAPPPEWEDIFLDSEGRSTKKWEHAVLRVLLPRGQEGSQ